MMNKIQEAFDKYLIAEGPIDVLEGAFCDKNEKGKESFEPSFWDVCNAFYNGYKAAEEALKCCGCCKWCEYISEPGIEDNYCLNKKAEDYDCPVNLAYVCDKWEARE